MTSGFKATDEEEQLATQILVLTHCQEAGALSSEAAIDIFRRSGLSFTILRDIWNIADKNGSGDLSHDELAMAIRLMGWVQMGEALDDGLLLKSMFPCLHNLLLDWTRTYWRPSCGSSWSVAHIGGYNGRCP